MGPHNGISGFIRKGRDRSLHHFRTREKAVIYKPEKKPSPGTKMADTLILYFLPSRTVRNKCLLCLLFNAFSLWYFILL